MGSQFVACNVIYLYFSLCRRFLKERLRLKNPERQTNSADRIYHNNTHGLHYLHNTIATARSNKLCVKWATSLHYFMPTISLYRIHLFDTATTTLACQHLYLHSFDAALKLNSLPLNFANEIHTRIWIDGRNNLCIAYVKYVAVRFDSGSIDAANAYAPEPWSFRFWDSTGKCSMRTAWWRLLKRSWDIHKRSRHVLFLVFWRLRAPEQRSVPPRWSHRWWTYYRTWLMTLLHVIGEINALRYNFGDYGRQPIFQQVSSNSLLLARKMCPNRTTLPIQLKTQYIVVCGVFV